MNDGPFEYPDNSLVDEFTDQVDDDGWPETHTGANCEAEGAVKETIVFLNFDHFFYTNFIYFKYYIHHLYNCKKMFYFDSNKKEIIG